MAAIDWEKREPMFRDLQARLQMHHHLWIEALMATGRNPLDVHSAHQARAAGLGQVQTLRLGAAKEDDSPFAFAPRLKTEARRYKRDEGFGVGGHIAADANVR